MREGKIIIKSFKRNDYNLKSLLSVLDQRIMKGLLGQPICSNYFFFSITMTRNPTEIETFMFIPNKNKGERGVETLHRGLWDLIAF